MGVEECGGGVVCCVMCDGIVRCVCGVELVWDGEFAIARRRRGIRVGAVVVVFDVSCWMRGEWDMVL